VVEMEKCEQSGESNVLIAIMIAGLCFRLLFALYFGVISTPDTGGYVSLAHEIGQGRFYTSINDTFRLPGYPVFIALVFWLSDGDARAVVVIQVLLSVFTVLLAHSAARRTFGPRVAAWAGWVTALNPALAYYAVVLLRETLMTFLVTASAWTLAMAIERRRLGWWASTGVLIAYLVWIKLVFVLLMPGYALAAALTLGWARAWKGLLAVTLPVVLIVGSWVAHNAQRYGYAGYVPALGHTLLARTVYLDVPANDDAIRLRALEHFRTLKEKDVLGAQADALYYSLAVIETWRELRGTMPIPQINRESMRAALRQIGGDPLGYVRTTFVELAYTWAGYTPHWVKWRPTNLGAIPDWSYLVLGPVLGVFLATLTVWGSVLTLLRRNWLGVAYIASVSGVTLASALLIPSDYRFRLPVETMVLTLCCYAALSISQARHGARGTGSP